MRDALHATIVERRAVPADSEDCGVEVSPSEVLRGLRRYIRKALDGGRGRLRMDPQDFADRYLAVLVDREVERLARIRVERERKKRFRDMLATPLEYLSASPDRRRRP